MDYAIGDVQGCFKTLQALLKKIQFRLDSDRLFFLGDVVNRGNNSLEVLRLIHSNKDNMEMVIGNVRPMKYPKRFLLEHLRK